MNLIVPYACTRDGAYAIVPCLDFPEETDIPAILDFISQQATINNIDHPSNISGDTVFIFHGLLDHRIKPRMYQRQNQASLQDF